MYKIIPVIDCKMNIKVSKIFNMNHPPFYSVPGTDLEPFPLTRTGMSINVPREVTHFKKRPIKKLFQSLNTPMCVHEHCI